MAFVKLADTDAQVQEPGARDWEQDKMFPVKRMGLSLFHSGLAINLYRDPEDEIAALALNLSVQDAKLLHNLLREQLLRAGVVSV